jgi:quercetin dioxygenase-like cupin family protein
MSTNPQPLRFVGAADAVVEPVPGRTHYWYCNPAMISDTGLLVVRAKFPPGQAHKFHRHPYMEEVLYILAGTCEQWVEREQRILGPGDSAYVPANVVHGSYNVGQDDMELLAILTPARNPGPPVVDVFDEEPWRSLRR